MNCGRIDNEDWLPLDFQPTCWSVICAKGKDAFNHVGNRRFRILCDVRVQAFKEACSKAEKTIIVNSILDAIRVNKQYGGGFVKQDDATGRWFEIDEPAAREKIGSYLRQQIIALCPVKLAARKEQRKPKCRRQNYICGSLPSFMSADLDDFTDAQVVECESSVSSVTDDRIQLSIGTCMRPLSLLEDRQLSLCNRKEVVDRTKSFLPDIVSEGYVDEFDSLYATFTECKRHHQGDISSESMIPCLDLSARPSYHEKQNEKCWHENITLLKSVCDSTFPTNDSLERAAFDYGWAFASKKQSHHSKCRVTSRNTDDEKAPVDFIFSDLDF